MNKIFTLPTQVKTKVEKMAITFTGPRKESFFYVPPFILLEIKSNKLYVINLHKKRLIKKCSAKFGTFCNNLKNILKGISNGHSIQLNLVGVGYRAENTGPEEVTFKLGYSKPILMKQDSRAVVNILKPTILQIRGSDIQKVAQKVANIRKLRYPEPYKGKGILIKGEIISRKEGKKLS